MRVCVIDGCEFAHHARGWCQMHYDRWRDHGTTDRVYRRWVNPLVCTCETPDARADRDFGECAICRRKPLALMAVSS